MSKRSPIAFYLLYFAALASMMPFLVLYYQQIDLSGAEIGLLTGGIQLISLAGGPILTGIADATRRQKRMMSTSLGILIVAGILFPFQKTLAPLFVLAALVALFNSPIVPLSDSAILFMLGSEKEKYGRISLCGTIGWGLAAPVIGVLVEKHGLNMAFWGFSMLAFLAFLVSQTYVFPPPVKDNSLRGNYWTFIANRRWSLFLVMAFVSGLGFAAVNNYLFAFMKELDMVESSMGIAVTIGTVAELPVLFFANRLLKCFGAQRLLWLTMLVTTGRLLFFGVLPSPAAVMALQLLNGLTMPLFWVAGVAYADENTPPGLNATAQGLFGAMVSGFGAAAGGLVGGPLLESIGGSGMYTTIGVVMLFSLALMALLRKMRLGVNNLVEQSL